MSAARHASAAPSFNSTGEGNETSDAVGQGINSLRDSSLRRAVCLRVLTASARTRPKLWPMRKRGRRGHVR